MVGTGLTDPVRIVVRLQPDRPAMFPTYDLTRQLACLRVLLDEPHVPVPRVYDDDPTGHRLGRPAFVMEFVAGRAPRDDGFEPIALLDWELATIGSPEQDLTWFLEMNHMRMQGAGLDPLPGFLTDDHAVDHYRRRSGHHLEHLDWYRYLAAVKVAVLMHRHLRAMVHAGRLRADHKLFAATVATRRLAQLHP